MVKMLKQLTIFIITTYSNSKNVMATFSELPFISLFLTTGICIQWHYDNTYKDIYYNDFTYDINKCDITYVFIHCYK